MNAWWAVVGALASGPLWVALTVWVSRRVWRNARRMRARSRGHEHLVELGQLAGGLAHEIKNPLSTINMNLKLLSEDLGRFPDETHRRWTRRLDGVWQEANRLKEILDDFLRYAGKHELHPEALDLRRLVGELTDFFAPQSEAAHVVMRTALPETPVGVRVDANLLKQALLNLMLNATQAMTGGGELLIRLSRQRDRAIVEVIDTGPGMTREEQGRLFDVYYSTRKGGTGLGLPTTRRIIREHDGTIHVQSEAGKGTRFIISLPLGKGGDD